MKILFVCTGNTCRSPMAEAVARELAPKMGLEAEFSSAGVAASGGGPASLGAQAAAAKVGADLENHRSTMLTRGIAEEADLILCMQESHARAVRALLPEKAGRVHTLLGFAGGQGDVEDPFGGDEEVYTNCLTQIGSAVRKVLEKLGEGTPHGY